jgi:acyl-CoA synthetase (NDP forming)
VEELLSGVELILGAKRDYQFGPVMLLGIGGTGVEIYKDVTLRMVPLEERDVESMVRSLQGHALIEGYRGFAPVNIEKLNHLLLTFSELIMDLEETIESIDLNPVMCTPNKCIVADARIMLK